MIYTDKRVRIALLMIFNSIILIGQVYATKFGIGIEKNVKFNSYKQLVVGDVVKGSSADMSKLAPGTIITHLNDSPVVLLDLDAVEKELIGDEYTSVKITLLDNEDLYLRRSLAMDIAENIYMDDVEAVEKSKQKHAYSVDSPIDKYSNKYNGITTKISPLKNQRSYSSVQKNTKSNSSKNVKTTWTSYNVTHNKKNDPVYFRKFPNSRKARGRILAKLDKDAKVEINKREKNFYKGKTNYYLGRITGWIRRFDVDSLSSQNSEILIVSNNKALLFTNKNTNISNVSLMKGTQLVVDKNYRLPRAHSGNRIKVEVIGYIAEKTTKGKRLISPTSVLASKKK